MSVAISSFHPCLLAFDKADASKRVFTSVTQSLAINALCVCVRARVRACVRECVCDYSSFLS